VQSVGTAAPAVRFLFFYSFFFLETKIGKTNWPIISILDFWFFCCDIFYFIFFH